MEVVPASEALGLIEAIHFLESVVNDLKIERSQLKSALERVKYDFDRGTLSDSTIAAVNGVLRQIQ